MIKIKDKKIGPDEKCFIVAEIGINHNGDMDLAIKTIDAAIASGADAVKFQNYYTDDFVLNKSLVYQYENDGVIVKETQYEMFKRCEFSFEQFKIIKEYCDSKNVIFFSTPTGERGIQELLNLKVSILKNGSDFLVNHEIIKQMAKTGLPLILSTGMATISEIDEAIRVFESENGKELILLHCISSYPTPEDEVNLLKIKSLEYAFGYPVGFSDHTWGNTAAIGAVCLGACFVEKHFTLDKSLPGPDHRFSSDPVEFKELVKNIRTLEANLGTSKIGPTKSELKSRYNFRLSCVAKEFIKKGDILDKNLITFSRPSGGIEPKNHSLLIGKKVNRNIEKGDIINFQDIF